MTGARKARRGCGSLLFLLVVVTLGGWGWFVNANREIAEARTIDGASTGGAWFDRAFVPAPVPGSVDANPYLAPGQNGTMHGDGYQSDTHLAAGPVRLPLDVRTRRAGNGLPRQCATFVHRSDGKAVAMCGGLSGFRIVLLDPETLRALATYDLPPRPSSFEALVKRDIGIIMNDSSGGAYLFLDNHDRVVLADSKMRIQRLAAVEHGGQWHFAVDGEWDLRPHVPHACLDWDNWFPSGECDKVTTVMPDYDGRLWWTTRNGRVGIIDPETGKVAQIALGEEIQNALAMDRDAVYVLSDHAQYAFSARTATLMRQLWREPYDRGTGRKVGSINQGSGTTPTLLGERWITFADNADDRINIVVLRRGTLKAGEQRTICKIPVFRHGASATDNSMIGWGRSILLENNSGYASAYQQKDWNSVIGGVVRVDIRADESGCDLVWDSPLRSPSVVAKLAAGSGIAWYYSYDQTKATDGSPVNQWAFVGLDFKTGKEVARIPTGLGKAYDNNWSSMSLAPDGTLYVGVTNGLVQVRGK